ILLGATQIVALFGASGASIGDVPSSPKIEREGEGGHG
ncbi:MAG: conjugal transfer protein, partial [Mesorhizobium sp.]